MVRALTLLSLLALPALAEDAPAPAPAAGEATAPPTTGAATTATPKGSGTKKARPENPDKPAEAEQKKQ